MSAMWLIETGTSSTDRRDISRTTGIPSTTNAFLTLACYIAASTGVQDAWIDGDTATLHAKDDRWVTLTAGDDVPDDELEAVMSAIRPLVATHEV